MTSSLHDMLQGAVREATLQRKRDELRVLRMVVSEIKQAQIDKRIELSDDNLSSILAKMIKQRRDSEKLFREADRLDLAEKEAYEIDVILQFLPDQLSNDEITDMVLNVIAETSASSMKDMGMVMGRLKGTLEGRADMAAVSQIVKEQLVGS